MLQKFHSFHNKSIGLLLVRIAVGIVFIAHGWAKIGAMDQTIGFFSSLGFSSFWAYLVAWVEFLGGIAILVGFLTPYAAIALSIVMLVAIFKVKAGKPFMGGWEFDFVLLFSLLGLLFSRAGKFAVPCPTNRNKCNCSTGCNCQAGKCTCPENK